jgi:hypothetical protein
MQARAGAECGGRGSRSDTIAGAAADGVVRGGAEFGAPEKFRHKCIERDKRG